MSEKRPTRDNKEPICSCCIEKHVHEILVVIEADAVSNPGAMMIHFKNALIALRAMMASIGLCSKAALAHSYTTILLSFE